MLNIWHRKYRCKVDVEELSEVVTYVGSPLTPDGAWIDDILYDFEGNEVSSSIITKAADRYREVYDVHANFTDAISGAIMRILEPEPGVAVKEFFWWA